MLFPHLHDMNKSPVLLWTFAVLLTSDAFTEEATIRQHLTTATTTTTTTTAAPTIHPPVRKPCDTLTSCENCLSNVSCLWCQSNNTCLDYPVSYIIPPASVCELSQARWAVCWVNFEALIIAMAVVCGALLVTVSVCCCYCCCCRRRRSPRLDSETEQYVRRREEIRQRAEERRADMKTRHDEIRKKYGLIPDSDHPYSKFENE